MLLALFLTLAAAPPPSVEAAAARYGPALVTVRWGEAEAASGFLVSSSGTVATVLPALPAGGDAGAAPPGLMVELPVEPGGRSAAGERRPARLLARDDDGVALLQLLGPAEGAPLLPALAVAEEDHVLAPQVWLLGLGVVMGRVEASLGGLRRVDERGRWRLDLPLERGAAVLHEGRVVALVLAREGRTASVAVPAGRLRALATRVGPRRAPPG